MKIETFEDLKGYTITFLKLIFENKDYQGIKTNFGRDKNKRRDFGHSFYAGLPLGSVKKLPELDCVYYALDLISIYYPFEKYSDKDYYRIENTFNFIFDEFKQPSFAVPDEARTLVWNLYYCLKLCKEKLKNG